MLHKNLLVMLCRAKKMLDPMEAQPRSIQQMADELGVSLYHFIRLFKAVFGETPNQYQMRIKLDKAKYLLATSDFSVTDICMEVGYSSVGSFSDLFSRRVGITPSDYRRKFRSSTLTTHEATQQLLPGCFSLMGGPPT